MRRRTFHAAATFLLVLGCAAGSLASCTEADCADLGTCEAPTTTDAAQPAQEAAPEAEPSPPVTNPYGEEYPTENLGWTPRALGSSTPGNVIPNVVFESAIRSHFMQPLDSASLESSRLQLADLFDPKQKKHDVIVLVLATAWDTVSEQFVEGLGGAPDGTTVLCVLGQGTPGEPPTLSDLKVWSQDHYWAWNALDGSFTALRKLYERARSSLPTVILIDATTMELAFFNVGRMSNAALDLEIQAIRKRR